MVGTDANFRINTVKVLKHTETPGLGAESQTVRYGEEEPYFETRFKGDDPLIVIVEKDDNDEFDNVESLTGATITTRAVCSSINKYAAAVKEKLAAPPVIYVDPENIISVEEILKKHKEEEAAKAEAEKSGGAE
jgi:electron transport complex protein RnfG